jgi:hypothetical protein
MRHNLCRECWTDLQKRWMRLVRIPDTKNVTIGRRSSEGRG